LPPPARSAILGGMEGPAVSRVWAALIVVAVLCLSYFVAYFALLDTSQCTGFAGWWGPRYRVGGKWAATVFAPLEWADVRVRPQYWSARANPGGQ
jgi:hypothetical protein